MTAAMLHMILHGTASATIIAYDISPREVLDALAELGCAQLAICPGCNEPDFTHMPLCPLQHVEQALGSDKTIACAKDVAIVALNSQLSESELDSF